ncbi:BBS1 (predicted) [Pycnogonum litorale]
MDPKHADGLLPKPSVEDSPKWLDAHIDPLATLYTFSSCIALADLHGDGDNKLIVADLGTGMYNMKLKVYKGTNLMSEHTIIDLPTGVASFYIDSGEPRIPAIAVASGSHIFVYKNMCPYFKFTLPSMEINETEQAVWSQARNEEINAKALTEVLSQLRNEIGESNLTARTLRLLTLNGNEVENFVMMYRQHPLKRQTVITTLESLKKSISDDNAISCLVLGTEHKQIYVVDSEAFTVIETLSIPSIPVFLSASGQYEVDYKIIIAARDSNIYIIRRGSKGVKVCASSQSPIVGLLKVSHSLVIGCMNDTISSFTSKGKEIWSVHLPASITAMETMVLTDRDISLMVVALGNSTVLFYREDCIIDTVHTTDIVTGIKFGRFGREDNTLILTTRSGGLIIKILKRTAQYNFTKCNDNDNEVTRLNIPKKTRLFIDQTMRERENSVGMFKTFQRDLYKMKLETARAYVKTIGSGLNPVSNNVDEPIKLSAQVQGLGPRFKLKLEVQNTSRDKPSVDLLITFQCDALMYSIHKNYISLPLLVPGVPYVFSTLVDCVSDLAVSDQIRVYIIKKDEMVPIVTAMINMPISEASSE